jgi:hypothetical protein
MAGAEAATPDVGACELSLTVSIARAMPTSTAAPAIPAVITLSAVRARELEGDVVVAVFRACCSLVLGVLVGSCGTSTVRSAAAAHRRAVTRCTGGTSLP